MRMQNPTERSAFFKMRGGWGWKGRSMAEVAQDEEWWEAVFEMLERNVRDS